MDKRLFVVLLIAQLCAGLLIMDCIVTQNMASALMGGVGAFMGILYPVLFDS